MDLEHLTFAKRFDAISGSAIREILKLTAQPGMISFAGGNPARSALPDETVARICTKVMRENGKGILQYGATEGYPALLEALYPYLQQALGVEIPQGGILPVTGSTQAMDLLCKALLNPLGYGAGGEPLLPGKYSVHAPVSGQACTRGER